jgi:hypothetical protein
MSTMYRGSKVPTTRMKWEPGEHEWFVYNIHNGVQACKRCGNVRRADDKNSPCKGITKVRTR